MLVFIDDSGDPGFKISKGSSSHFVITCVIFDDELVAEEIALAIKKYRRIMKFPDSMEFKFVNSKPSTREGFLRTVSKFPFRVRALVVDKSLITSTKLKTSKDSFYSYFVKQVLIDSKGGLHKAKIRLDGHGDRVFRRNFTTYLRRELNNPKKKIMKDMKLVDSKENVLIQMADMIAGSIRRSYDKTKKDSQIYRKIIKNKIENCWEFK